MEIDSQKYVESAKFAVIASCIFGGMGAVYCYATGLETPLKGALWTICSGALAYGVNEWKKANPWISNHLENINPCVPFYLSLYATSALIDFPVNKGMTMIATMGAVVAVIKGIVEFTGFSRQLFNQQQIQ